MNRLGLARLFRRAISDGKPVHDRLLRKINELTGTKYTSAENWFRDLEKGKLSVDKDTISELSSSADVFDLLTWEFLFPAVPGQVVVRRMESGEQVDWADMGEVAKQFPNVQPRPGVTYEIPRRNLACSDLVITRLTLDKQTSTPSNRHPGFELLLPLTGEVTVEYDGNDICEVASGKQLAYYRSDVKHRIYNKSDTRAEIFLIRLYGEKSGIEDSPTQQ